MRKAQDVVFLWNVMLRAGRVSSLSKAFYTYRSNPYSVTKHQTLAKVAFSDRILRAAEILRMLERNEVLPALKDDMLRSVRWCANSNLELIGQMSEEERGRYYDEMDRHRDAVKVVKPFMNRKHRFLYGMSLGKRAWLAKAGWMSKLDRKKHS